MKFSWTSLKISIAGARLSHLVQKDGIWDHGSMAEQARIIFYLVYKAKASGNIASLKNQCSESCFAKLKTDIDEYDRRQRTLIMNPVVKEIAIVDVQPGKKTKPDSFCAIIKFYLQDMLNKIESSGHTKEFVFRWSFVRQGDWWVLDEIKTR